MEKNKKVYNCQEKGCDGQRFATAWSLRRHKDHVCGKEFFCLIENCNEKFNSRAAMSKHKKDTKKISSRIDVMPDLWQRIF